MGCNARDKPLRHSRKPRHSTKLHPQQQALHHHLFHHPHDADLHPDPDLPGGSDSGDRAGSDESGWGYCTEEQLEELLLRNLDFVYREALAKLASLGYDDDLSLRAVLRNGHCYGSMDVLSNILHNALSYINNNNNSSVTSSSSPPASTGSDASPEPAAFSDLRHLEEYSLAGMVCLLQQVRPHLTRCDAMWCLLMSDLHVGRASAIDVPVLSPLGHGDFPGPAGGASTGGLCRFRGDSDVESLRRFDLSPALKSFLKQNVAAFAAEYRANLKRPWWAGSFSEEQHSEGDVVGKDSENSDVVTSVLSSLENLSIDEAKTVDSAEDKKKVVIMDLICQIRELEEQVKERKEWAQQKALQAARKLSNDLAELKMLRMEREESLRMKKVRQGMEESMTKRLEEMEDVLRKAMGQVDLVKAGVRRLEIENSEIKADMRASELSASESASRVSEMMKRDKKCLKRVLAWEKQRVKLQVDVAKERNNIVELQQELNRIKEGQKEAEVKCRQEVKAKEQAIAQVVDEQRAREAVDASIKRKQEALRQKIELDFQRYTDDIQRLKEELSRLNATAGSAHLNSPSLTTLFPGDRDGKKTLKEANPNTLHELHKPQDSSPKEVNHDRECLICMNDEVSVVFLPCAHQVLCVSCNAAHEKRAKTCPCCSFQIEQRIRVFGACA